MKRYLLFVMLCVACPGLQAQVLQIDADGTVHRIGPTWSEPAASPAVATSRPPRTLQLVLDTGGGGLLEYDPSAPLAAVHNYLARNRDGRAISTAHETTRVKVDHSYIRDVNFDPNAVIRLAGCVGFQTTVEFPADERIENVGMGAASRWLVVPNKRADLLFVEPASALNHTNMTVVTDRHRYYFELVSRASAACRDGTVTYSLRLHAPVAPSSDTAFQATSWSPSP